MTNPIETEWKPVKATLKERVISTGGELHFLPHFKTHVFNVINGKKKVVLLIFLKWAFSWTYVRTVK